MSVHIFGPVPSRRLGRSLGVDLVPFKTCTYDCIYCQLGPTTCKTAQRQEWVPRELILQELRKKLDTRPDYITLSRSGEPTLFTPLDKLIEGIRALTDTPIAVLTNGSLLGHWEVQRELALADLVIPSVDAGDHITFRQVNRPDESISFDCMLAGLIDFRRCVDLIRPDRVQLNTVTRPPAEDYVLPVPRARLEEIAATFSPPAEVIAEFHSVQTLQAGDVNREEVLQLLRRRPCSIDDIVGGLGMHRNEVLKSLEHLQIDGQIKEVRAGDNRYYSASPPTD